MPDRSHPSVVVALHSDSCRPILRPTKVGLTRAAFELQDKGVVLRSQANVSAPQLSPLGDR
jgi:hypothetical protein